MSQRGRTGEGRRRSVSSDTDWEKIPGGKLGGVFNAGLKRILGLRAKFGVDARILVKNEDPKSAFRQVGFDPDGASAFEYRLGPSEFVEFRL